MEATVDVDDLAGRLREPVREQRDATSSGRLRVVDVPADGCTVLPHRLELGEARDALRRHGADRSRGDEIHSDAVEPGQRVLIIDDVLATGGTAAATTALVRKLGGDVQALAFLVELEFLNGRRRVPKETVYSVLKYSA